MELKIEGFRFIACSSDDDKYKNKKSTVPSSDSLLISPRPCTRKLLLFKFIGHWKQTVMDNRFSVFSSHRIVHSHPAGPSPLPTPESNKVKWKLKNFHRCLCTRRCWQFDGDAEEKANRNVDGIVVIFTSLFSFESLLCSMFMARYRDFCSFMRRNGKCRGKGGEFSQFSPSRAHCVA